MLIAYKGKGLVAGLDEAGRGCLAGPVFAAAVILPQDYRNRAMNDSKKISPARRDNLRIEIEREALAWACAMTDHRGIDEMNILNASIQAMHLAVSSLSIRPDFLIVDGNRFRPYQDINHRCFVKGDARYMSIAAASIMAKTERDAFMDKLHMEYPGYGWDRNKGYPTREHFNAIIELGVSPHHRLSFTLYKHQKELF